jgi:hypothetical protein
MTGQENSGKTKRQGTSGKTTEKENPGKTKGQKT